MTLLHWACDRGHEDVVRYLIKNKAKVNAQVWSRCSACTSARLSYILEGGGGVNFFSDHEMFANLIIVSSAHFQGFKGGNVIQLNPKM